MPGVQTGQLPLEFNHFMYYTLKRVYAFILHYVKVEQIWLITYDMKAGNESELEEVRWI